MKYRNPRQTYSTGEKKKGATRTTKRSLEKTVALAGNLTATLKGEAPNATVQSLVVLALSAYQATIYMLP